MVVLPFCKSKNFKLGLFLPGVSPRPQLDDQVKKGGNQDKRLAARILSSDSGTKPTETHTPPTPSRRALFPEWTSARLGCKLSLQLHLQGLGTKGTVRPEVTKQRYQEKHAVGLSGTNDLLLLTRDWV